MWSKMGGIIVYTEQEIVHVKNDMGVWPSNGDDDNKRIGDFAIRPS